jgi:hypothetical protein
MQHEPTATGQPYRYATPFRRGARTTPLVRTWRCIIALHCTPAARRRSSRRRTTIPVEIIAIQQYKHPGFSSHGQVLHDHKESYCYYVELGEYSGKCTNFTEANGSGIHGYRLVQESKRCDDRAAPAQQQQ